MSLILGRALVAAVVRDRSPLRPCLLIGLVALALAIPTPVLGRHSRRPAPAVAVSDPSDLHLAEAALAAHDLVVAEQQLVAAYRRTRPVEALYLLGTVARERGDLVATHDYFRRYLGDPGIDDSSPHGQDAQKFLTQRRGPAGELQVVGEAGALVLVDGHLLGALPLAQPLLLAVGTHQVRLEVGRKELSVQLQIADGRGTEVRFVPDYDALLVSVPPAVLVLAEWASAPPATQRRLLQDAQQAIRRANHAVFDTDTALARAPKLKDCLHEQRCRLQLAAQNEIDFVLTLQVNAPVAATGAWAFAAALFSPRIELPAATAQRDCASCTLEQAAAQLAALIEETVQKGGVRGSGSLQVASVPDGAQVRLGSVVLGKTPATLTLWAGEYDLTLALPGGPPSPVHATVKEGTTALEPVPVQPLAPPVVVPVAVTPSPRGRQKRPRWRLAIGGIAVAAGVLLLGNGISAAAIDGHCVNDLGSGPPACLDYFATGSAAAGLLGVGAAATLGGIILLAVPGTKSP